MINNGIVLTMYYARTKQLSFERICKYSHHEKHDKCGKIHRKHIPTENVNMNDFSPMHHLLHWALIMTHKTWLQWAADIIIPCSKSLIHKNCLTMNNEQNEGNYGQTYKTRSPPRVLINDWSVPEFKGADFSKVQSSGWAHSDSLMSGCSLLGTSPASELSVRPEPEPPEVLTQDTANPSCPVFTAALARSKSKGLPITML